MAGSVPIAQALLPIISKAAINTGYLGTIGTGIASIGLLANTKIAKETVRLLIAKTGVLGESQAAKQAFAQAMRDADEFDDVQAEINMALTHVMLRGDKERRTDDWHMRPKRLRDAEIRRVGGGPSKKARY